MPLPTFFLRYLFQHLRLAMPYLLVILLIDLFPLVGVWFFGWNAFNVVFVYFVETFILLIFTWLKMRKAAYLFAILQRGEPRTSSDRAPSNYRLLRLGSRLIQTLANTLAAISGALRPLLGIGFLLLNFPLAFLQLYILTALAGEGLHPWNFLGHSLGQFELGPIRVPMFPLIVVMLFAEHWFFYQRTFVGRQEFLNTGVINEGLRFQVRMVIQAVIMLLAFALLFSGQMANALVLFLIGAKVVLDTVGFLWNRLWGAATNKQEGYRTKQELEPQEALPPASEDAGNTGAE